MKKGTKEVLSYDIIYNNKFLTIATGRFVGLGSRGLNHNPDHMFQRSLINSDIL